MDRLSRPIVVLDGLPGLYGFKFDSATACGLPLYLCSYKLDGSITNFLARLVSSRKPPPHGVFLNVLNATLIHLEGDKTIAPAGTTSTSTCLIEEALSP